MTHQTLKIIAITAIVTLVIVAGLICKISADRNAGPRPGVDIPLRGM